MPKIDNLCHHLRSSLRVDAFLLGDRPRNEIVTKSHKIDTLNTNLVLFGDKVGVVTTESSHSGAPIRRVISRESSIGKCPIKTCCLTPFGRLIITH